jgi:NADPH-dependent 2,4-dienoyl-CoA reductase/sulfur reductase-like enzyme
MTVDLAIVGAGPARMAAAVLAAELRLGTVLIDEQASPGGQIYKGIERFPPNSPFRPDYSAGRSLVAALRSSRVGYRPGTTLWHIDREGTLYLEHGGRTETVTARRVLLATGALERPVPIPGWTSPGVMTVGAAQTLLKSSDVVAEGRTVLAGQGPLLYLLAAQLAGAAALSGRLAALDAAEQLGYIGETERDNRGVPIRAALDRELALRPLLNRLYRPPRSVLVPIDDDIIACRCEEVAVGQIRRATKLGAPGPNQLKAFTRCGMRPCQGRICGPIVSAVIADALGKPIAEIGTYRPRAPFKPITLGALADLDREKSGQGPLEAPALPVPHPPTDAGPPLPACEERAGVRGG